MIYQHTPTVAPEEAASPSALALCTYSTTGGKRAAMKMHDIEVAIHEEEIMIAQTDFAGEQVLIKISPEQAEFFCTWVMSAAKRLEDAEGK